MFDPITSRPEEQRSSEPIQRNLLKETITPPTQVKQPMTDRRNRLKDFLAQNAPTQRNLPLASRKVAA